jgi:23S rRNA (uridine2552-2'-O)-methyltransferase
MLSDMAPKLSGVRDRDEARSLELAEIALALATHLLRPGGKLLLKLFDGRDTPQLVARMRKTFNSVQNIRPQATRRGSSELYALACDLRSPTGGGDSRVEMPFAK